ncbi:hypothetical protein BV25DRAFT_1916924 [Artomyces pyxidatus]|uniref:Uncharacterized protein n=1 Tax=Artomyces pyxidatus TaxID=48021 RepID=A0ACB8T0H1_9AGAM|nr:hypothetical protein BV25DRAFT_1916924 [Artomyces pyxidatus]
MDTPSAHPGRPDCQDASAFALDPSADEALLAFHLYAAMHLLPGFHLTGVAQHFLKHTGHAVTIIRRLGRRGRALAALVAGDCIAQAISFGGHEEPFPTPPVPLFQLPPFPLEEQPTDRVAQFVYHFFALSLAAPTDDPVRDLRALQHHTHRYRDAAEHLRYNAPPNDPAIAAASRSAQKAQDRIAVGLQADPSARPGDQRPHLGEAAPPAPDIPSVDPGPSGAMGGAPRSHVDLDPNAPPAAPPQSAACGAIPASAPSGQVDLAPQPHRPDACDPDGRPRVTRPLRPEQVMSIMTRGAQYLMPAQAIANRTEWVRHAHAFITAQERRRKAFQSYVAELKQIQAELVAITPPQVALPSLEEKFPGLLSLEIMASTNEQWFEELSRHLQSELGCALSAYGH